MSRRHRSQPVDGRGPDFATARDDEGTATDLVVAVGPDLTGRVHLAYRRRPDRRWWRRVYPGWSIPRWDHVSLCGRRGLVLAEAWQRPDCQSCRRVHANRRRRLASRLGDAGERR